MQVLMYGWEFPPRISGGLGMACYAIVKELAQKGLKVTLVLPEVIGAALPHENVSIKGCASEDDSYLLFLESLRGIEIQRTGVATFLQPYLQDNSIPNEFLGKCQALDVAQLLDNLHKLNPLREEIDSLFGGSSSLKFTGKYGSNLLAEVFYYALVAGALADRIPHDVIHVHDWLTVLAGIEAKKRSGKPLVFHVHALESDRSGVFIDGRIFAIEKYGMEKADKIVAVSQYTKNMIVEKYGIPADKIEIVHNGHYFIDYADLHNNKIAGNKMVLFVGRLAHQKGPHCFLEVARKILEVRDDVHFVIAGTGGLMRELVDRVASWHLGKNIHFTGFLGAKDVAHAYRLADVYVMPSVSEPFGLSCLEALSHQIPVVISKQSGVAEVVHNALKVDFWDVNEMANKILALLTYPALKKEALKHTDNELKELTWDKTANSIINLYNKLH
jgi:glycosyltransferase involved in cell wall biosynthesis